MNANYQRKGYHIAWIALITDCIESELYPAESWKNSR